MDNIKRLVAIFGESEVVNKTQDELMEMLIDKYLLIVGKNLKPLAEIPKDFDNRIFKQEWIDEMSKVPMVWKDHDDESRIEYYVGVDTADGLDKGVTIVMAGSSGIKRIGFHSVASHLIGMSLSTITTDRVLPTMTRPICPELIFPEVLPIVNDINKSVNPSERKYQSKSKKQRRKK
jgi:hypothetical protein